MWARGRGFLTAPEAFSICLEYGHYDPRDDAAAPVRLAVPVARLELAWTSDLPESGVVEQLVQLHKDVLRQNTTEHVRVTLQPSADGGPGRHVSLQLSVEAAAPVLRCITFQRSSSTGTASNTLLAALLQQLDLSGVWKLSGCDGVADCWHAAAPVAAWHSLRNLNLSSCGLSTLSPVVGDLALLKILRLTSNKLTTLPPEVGRLRQLEVLAADHNQLTSLPADLRRCTSLKELHLEGNKLVNLLLDLGQLGELQSLQLFGNPLQYLPELAPAAALRSLSLANVRILADSRYSRWEVEVAAPGSSMVPLMGRSHKLAALFGLVFRRSSISHPLLTGALARLAEDPENCELLLKEEVALAQLVAASMSNSHLVAAQAVAVLRAISGQPGAARKLIRHNAVRAITLLVASEDESQQLGGLSVLSRLAAGAEERDHGERLVPTQLLDRLLVLARQAGSQKVRCAVLEALGNSAFDPLNRRRYLQSPGLMQLLVEMANPAGRPRSAPSDAALHGAGMGEGSRAPPQLATASGTDIPELSDVQKHAIRLLAILGQNEQVRIALRQPPIRGRGLRILAMDGGGMKGLAMVEMLRQLERRAGRPVWSLFDVIGGTSTGALLAVALGVLRLSLDECQDIYTNLGNKVFHQSGVVQEDAGWKDSLYRLYSSSASNMRVAVYGYKHDAGPYETLLKEFCQLHQLGCVSDRMIDTAVLGGPKVFVVATRASQRPAAPFVMRNYELPFESAPLAGQVRACEGSCRHHVWQAVRASSAAPYYLEDFLCGPDRFQDGAATANNPALIALQQGRLLHPDLPVEVLVSLGCGSEPAGERGKGLSSVMDTGTVLVESACSVERVHEALATCLPLVAGVKYYRFSPVDPRCAMELDEVNPEAWRKLLAATTAYCTTGSVSAAFDELTTTLTTAVTLPATGGPAASPAAGVSGPGESVGGGVAWRQQQQQYRPQQQGWRGLGKAGVGLAALTRRSSSGDGGAPSVHPPSSPSWVPAATIGSGGLAGAPAGSSTSPRGRPVDTQGGSSSSIPRTASHLQPVAAAPAAAVGVAGMPTSAYGTDTTAAAVDASTTIVVAADEAVQMRPGPLAPTSELGAPAAAAAAAELAAPGAGQLAARAPLANQHLSGVSDMQRELSRELSLQCHVPPSQQQQQQQQAAAAVLDSTQQQQQQQKQGIDVSPHLGYRRRLLLLEAPRLFPEQLQQHTCLGPQGWHPTPEGGSPGPDSSHWHSPHHQHYHMQQQQQAHLPPGSYAEAVAAQLTVLMDPELLIRVDLGAADWSQLEGHAPGAAADAETTSRSDGAAASPSPVTSPAWKHQQQQQQQQSGGRRSQHTDEAAPASAAEQEGAAHAASGSSSWLGMLFPWQSTAAGPEPLRVTSSPPAAVGAGVVPSGSSSSLAMGVPSTPTSPGFSPASPAQSGAGSWWGAAGTSPDTRPNPLPATAAGSWAAGGDAQQQQPHRSPSPTGILPGAADVAEALTAPGHGVKAAAAAAAGMAVAAGHVASGHHHEPPRQQQVSRAEPAQPSQATTAAGSGAVSNQAGGAGAASILNAPLPAVAGVSRSNQHHMVPSHGQQQHMEPGPVAVLRSALQLGAAAGVGVVHLALHGGEEGDLVLRWTSGYMSVVEPGPEAAQLLADLGCSGARLGEVLQPVGQPVPTHALQDGRLVRLLAGHTIHGPGAASGAAAGGITTWLLQQVVADAGSLLRVEHVYPLLSLLQQLLVVSTGWLPGELLRALLQGGAHMVVVPISRHALEGLSPQDLADFFAHFYACLYEGSSVIQALWEAGNEVPQVGNDRYAAYQL